MSPPRRPRRCIIKGCASVAGRKGHHGVQFNPIPLNPNMRQHWLTNCGITDTKSIRRKLLVCSRHFRRADFQALKENKYFLKHGAVPTIFPWGTFPYIEPTSHTAIDTGQQLMNNTVDEQPEITQQQLTHEIIGIKTSESASEPKTIHVSSVPVVAASQFSVGTRIEAQDIHGVWHSAIVVEVESHEMEVLIQFDSREMEWIPINSSRFRPFYETFPTFMPGEKCLARWTDTRKYLATVKTVLGNSKLLGYALHGLELSFTFHFRHLRRTF